MNAKEYCNTNSQTQIIKEWNVAFVTKNEKILIYKKAKIITKDLCINNVECESMMIICIARIVLTLSKNVLQTERIHIRI